MAADRDEPHSIDDLAFIAGHWVGAQEGRSLEETWLPPGGGIMVGLHRDVKDDGSVFYEFLRIEVRGARIYYVSRPSNQPEAEFQLKRVTIDDDGVSPATPTKMERIVIAVAIFENPAHDYPQRIIYELYGDGHLRASIAGSVEGKERTSSWDFRPADNGSGR